MGDHEEEPEVVTCPMSEARPFDPVTDGLDRLRHHLRRLVTIHRGQIEEKQAELAGAPVRKPVDHDGKPYPRQSTENLPVQLQVGLRRLVTALYASERHLRRKRAGRAYFDEVQKEVDTLAWIESLDTPVARDPLEVRLEGCAHRRATELAIVGAGLAAVPQVVWSIRSLRELDLSGNQLASFPADVGRLSHLRVLNLSGNQLAKLPGGGALERLTLLETIFLGGNQLTSLPADLFTLPALRAVHAQDNAISEVPAGETLSIGGALEHLDLSGNPITKVNAEDLAECATLSRLSLARCRLETVPEELLHSETLTALDVAGNESLREPPAAVADQGRSAMLKWFKAKAIAEQEEAERGSGSEEESDEESSEES